MVLPLVGSLVCVLTYAYGVHMQREIVFDEAGLHNAVYTFYTTGQMTYPMHHHPDFMVVHPPTHYAIIALLMKLGIPLMAASAVPVIVLTVILTLVIVTGPFSTATSVGLLLGYFVAMTTWSEFYTLRPDLHVTAAWFTSLVTLESARLRAWSAGRLFLGSTLAVLAASVHYWGVSALLLPVVYSALLVQQRGFRPSFGKLAAVAGGGCLVGVPFLVWFVIPLHGPIMQMVSVVQGDGTALDAFARHMASYERFAARLVRRGGLRVLSSALAAPALLLSVPAVFLSVPLLVWNRETRALALAGALLPLFVLFVSQGKQVGYTGYFTPEFMLLFCGVLITLLKLAETWIGSRRRGAIWMATAITGLAAIAYSGVPQSMGREWAWTRRLDTLELLHAAAQRVIGQGAVTAVTSAGVWYTGGGTYVWNAYLEVADANRRGQNVVEMLSPVDAVVLDSTNWWTARQDLAPTGTWYVDGLLHLKGFVLPNGDATRPLMLLFLSTKATEPVRGVFLYDHRAQEFEEDGTGSEALVVMACPRTVNLDGFRAAYYRSSFAYDRQPGPDSPSIVVLGMSASSVLTSDRLAQTGCTVRDSRRGRLRHVDLDELRGGAETEPRIRFFMSGRAALVSAGRIPPLVDSDRSNRSPENLQSPETRVFGSPVITITDQTAPHVNVYGSKEGRLITDRTQQVFAPADARDHIEYGLMNVPPAKGDDVWARVVVDASAPLGSPSCRVEVKDVNFEVLATLECSSSNLYVNLPDGTAALRVYVSDPKVHRFALPKRIEISLSQPRE
jgi:hypothetical protein